MTLRVTFDSKGRGQFLPIPFSVAHLYPPEQKARGQFFSNLMPALQATPAGRLDKSLNTKIN
jgi:hypothetical protein